MAVSIKGVISTKLGLVSHQNAVPLLRELTVENDGEEGLDDLVLEFEPSLPFAAGKTWRIDRLGPDSSITVTDRDVELREGYLADLTEGVQTSVHLRVRLDDDVVADERFRVELLARSQWGGGGSMPELLAAFCMPNDPEVDRVLKSASDVLRRAGRPDAIDGYEGHSRKRVWELTSAIWSAVCGYRISYVLPPAGFEQDGQKVRPPSQVLELRVGTCLDTALLFAAALEQAGLNPIMLLTKGHAFTGVWLQPQEFAQVLNEDVAAVRKRVELQELLVFETTLATQSSPPGFSHAVDAARRQLTDDDFLMALDVHRARMQKLRPLTTSAHATTETQEDGRPRQASEGLEAAPDLPAFDLEVEEVPSTPAGKLELWQRKLLDLTTRNRMLHLPDRAKVVRLVCPEPDKLEDVLAANKKVRIVPMPDLEVGGRDREIYARRNLENLEEEAARQCMARNEVLSRMDKGTLEARLIDLFRKAKSDLDEGGSNTLFLAIGFLRWKKAEDDPSSYYAPLILLPVRLERKSAVSPVQMSLLDDEPRFNLTLLELLRHDFQLDVPALEGDLPTDASGIDVQGIWNVMRRAVRDMPGFEVVTDVVLGTFSFSKYLMWRDLLDRSDQLMKNEVVHHLLNHKLGDSSLESPEGFPEPERLDALVEPKELFTPLPADSSQLAAVVASSQGHNFVLDGPPGTGKSQTIANMIAHNLALGRRVLFVAEKMAALDVVKRRLDQKGIGQFCLELHSSKSSKKHVLEQLDRTWAACGRRMRNALNWDEQAEKVRARRDRLNRMVEALHKRWPNGWSVHEAIGLAVRNATPSTPRFTWSNGTQHNSEQMERLRDVARRLDLNREAVQSLGGRMALVTRTEWSNAWQETMVNAARRALSALDVCDQACQAVVRQTGLPEADPGRMVPFASLLPEAHDVDLRFAFSPTLRKTLESVQRVVSLLKDYGSLEENLSQPYAREAVRNIDVVTLRDEWEQASAKFWALQVLAKRKVAKRLGERAQTPAHPDVEADLSHLARMKEIVTELDDLDENLRDVPGWSALKTDRSRMVSAARLAKDLRAKLIPLAASPEELIELRKQVERIVVDSNEILEPNGPVAESIRQLTSRYEDLGTAAEAFGRAAGSEIDLASQVGDLRTSARAVVENEKALNAWSSWQRVRQEAVSCDLGPLIEAVEQGVLPDGSVADAFEVAYARWFASKAIDAEPALLQFVPAEHQSDVDAYRKAVDELADLTSAYIQTRLSGGIPDKNDVTRRSGLGILKHELQKKQRHKPVRQLAQEMGEDFTMLAPCMLMSPLSIAQYLPADYELFDLVIFDEASQIAPWDAVGAIARGRQVVIAGDARQMPPTNFFNRGTDSGDDDTDEDMESILDECIGAGLPERSLTWHYRSRHESLITFSNYRYYDGRLVTFPAADTRRSVVSWRKVDGVYSPGKGGRKNQVEAKAIVEEVVGRLADPGFVASGQSIGIITLNAEQQQLVEDLLDGARRENRRIERFFKEDMAEPVMVKNLETMQGDERDLIILGIGFGPTEPEANTMSMNFGPLNREGGWRRLNVAVTRARQEMMIFTSFYPSMIDLNRTSARAVQDLRHFVEFAHEGPKAITSAVRGSVGDYDSPFEEFVADGLRTKGWEVHPQIGVSRFRIDLGVVHPDRPGDYLVGVECDGATYHSAATARDRDKVRAEILRGLGWRLVRVWSTEWWIDREHALERLHRAISDHLEQQHGEAWERARDCEGQRGRSMTPHADDIGKRRVQETSWHTPTSGAKPDREAEMQRALEVQRRASQDTRGWARRVDTSEAGRACPSKGGGQPSSERADEDARRPEVPAGQDNIEPESIRIASDRGTAVEVPIQRAYRKADLSELEPSLQPDDFHDASYDATLEMLIRRVLECEAPILDKCLVDRIARAHGFKRSGRLIRERVLELAERHYYFQSDPDLGHGDFVWLKADDPGCWNIYRVPEREKDVRFVEELPPQEILAAARSITAEDVAVETARIFGIRRLSSGAKSRIARIIGAPTT